MQVTLWGTRGSLATPGPATARYGGNTSCVAVRGREGTIIVLDAGTGVRPMAATIDDSVQRVDVLLTHLHMDHIQGLGFFAPLYRPGVEVNIWGPASVQMTLQARLMAVSVTTTIPGPPAGIAVQPETPRGSLRRSGYRRIPCRVCAGVPSRTHSGI
jgi:phosphoribosyl 1,2-cyclic phosphodiesterase